MKFFVLVRAAIGSAVTIISSLSSVKEVKSPKTAISNKIEVDGLNDLTDDERETMFNELDKLNITEAQYKHVASFINSIAAVRVWKS